MGILKKGKPFKGRPFKNSATVSAGVSRKRLEKWSLRWWLKWIKPSSNAWRTTLLLGAAALLLQVLSLQFFWHTFYKPELKQHAHFLAEQLQMHNDEVYWPSSNISFISDPQYFPTMRSKWFAEQFTSVVQRELDEKLGQSTVVYFQFKPTPKLWVYVPSEVVWLKEELNSYGSYRIEVILLWLLGTPILTLVLILVMLRTLNKPLLRLQQAAQSYTHSLQAPKLDTQHGSIEIRQVNHAFNHMLSTIEQTDLERRTMLAGISHDLRTPLTRMRLGLELLNADADDKASIASEIDEIDGILQQFMLFMQYGQDEALQPVFLQDVLAQVRQQYQHYDIRLNIPALPIMQLRAVAMKRVIGNIISNAQKYGQPPVIISAEQVGEEVVLTITDSGQTPQAQRLDLSSMFRPFVRGESARTQQGTGLGLAIVERVIRCHGGGVTLSYSPLGAFVVTIVLPLAATVDSSW